MLLVDGHESLIVGGVPIRAAEKLCRHVLLLGAPGSGKSLTFNDYMAGIFSEPTPFRRALVNDVKGDNVAVLRSYNIEPVILHPFDQRCTYPDLAQAVLDDPGGAPRLIAEALLPRNVGDKQAHFIDSARLIVAGAIRALHDLAPGKWGFDDLVWICRSAKALKQLLGACVHTSHLIDRFNDSDEFSSVFATISTRMDAYDTLAQAWRLARRAGRTISLRQWATDTPPAEQRVLLLGNDDSRRQSTQFAGRVILSLLMSYLLSSGQQSSSAPRTFLLLDEFPDLCGGRVEGFPQFLAKSRSYGISTFVGSQTKESFTRDYGPNDAGVILGCMGTICAFKTVSTETAEWLSQLAGDIELPIERYSFSGTESTTSVGPEIRRAVLPSEFLDLAYPSREDGAPAVFFHDRWVWPYTFPYDIWPPIPKDTCDNYLPIDPQELILTPLTVDDVDRLGLPDDFESLRAFRVAPKTGPLF